MMYPTKHALKIAATLVLTSGVLVGCSVFSKNDNPRDPVALLKIDSPVNVLTPVFMGEADKGKVRGERTSSKDALDLQMAVDGDVLIVASRTGVVTSYQGNAKLWSVSVDEPIVSGVAYDSTSQTAVVSTRSGRVIALDGNTGQQRWETKLTATVLTPALMTGNRVLLSANDGTLHGLSLQSGNSIWQFSTQSPVASVRGTAKPLRLDSQTAVFGTADGRIHAVSPEVGTPLWTRRVGVAIGGSEVGRMGDVDGTPLMVGNRLYVTSHSGTFAGFDMSTGQTMFVNREFASTHAVALFGDILVGVDTDGYVYGFNPTTGEKLWKNNALKFRKPSNPAVVGEYIAIGDYDGAVHLFNLQGDLVGRTSIKGKGQISSLQVHGNRLYAQTSHGGLAVWQF
ncbi:MAG: outer membrane protein assembly factor BamB [Moraxella sp.]|nr:outer membrane protein assembly factor BamB [Moraxella sp.]